MEAPHRVGVRIPHALRNESIHDSPLAAEQSLQAEASDTRTAAASVKISIRASVRANVLDLPG